MRSEVGFVTKILVPRRRREVLRRGRLLDYLSRDTVPLRIVRAPAGFGKTTVLVDLAHDAGATVCWLSLDEWDRDTTTFFFYLGLSVGSHFGGKRSEPQASRGDTNPRAVLAAICNQIASSGTPVWIMLDDFHALEGANDLLSHVDYFAQRLPLNAAIFLASRTQPALPSLSRMRVNGEVLEVGPADLAFTADEVREFYAGKASKSPTDNQIRRIMALTQGWPAGVALIDDSSSIDQSGQAPTGLAEYLAAEILDRLPEPVGQFLLRTSVFDTLEAEGCDRVLGSSTSNDVLPWLEKQNVPLVRLESAGSKAYRLHPLFRDFLRQRLQDHDAGLYRRLQTLAGEWCRSVGRTSEAVWHLAQAEDWNKVAELVEQEAPAAYRQGRWQTITTWLETLPADELNARPDMRLWEARVLVRLGQANEVLKIVQECLGPGERLGLSISAEFECLRSAALRVKGDVAAAVAAGRRAVDYAISSNSSIEVHAEARKQLALALFADGAFGLCEHELRAVREVYEHTGNVEEAAAVNASLGSALASLGRLPESVLHLEQARQQWHKIGNHKELSWVLNNLAMVYQLMGQTARAEGLFLESLSTAREAGHPRAEAYALVSLADIDRRESRFERAVSRFREGLAISGELGDMTLTTHALVGLSDVDRRRGNLSEATALAHRALASAEERGSAYEQGLSHGALGRICKQQGNLAEATAAFGAAAGLFERVDAKKDLAESLYHLADAALPARQRRTQLREALDRLAIVAEEMSYDHFLVELCREAPAVAEYGASLRGRARFYRDLLRKSATTSSSRPEPGHSVERSTIPVVEIRALGTFEVLIDGRPVLSLEWESEKSREFLLLLLTRQQPMSRDEIVALLWPEAGGKRAVSSFHSTLYRVRHALYQGCIVESGGKYRLNSRGVFVSDVARFQAMTAALPGDQLRRNLENLMEAVTLYRGPFAPSIDSEWADSLRRQLEERFLSVAIHLTEKLLANGDALAAAHVCERMIENDPYDERAYLLLMQALVMASNTEGALRAFERYRDLLRKELDEPPGPDISSLHQNILRRLHRTSSEPS